MRVPTRNSAPRLPGLGPGNAKYKRTVPFESRCRAQGQASIYASLRLRERKLLKNDLQHEAIQNPSKMFQETFFSKTAIFPPMNLPMLAVSEGTRKSGRDLADLICSQVQRMLSCTSMMYTVREEESTIDVSDCRDIATAMGGVVPTI